MTSSGANAAAGASTHAAPEPRKKNKDFTLPWFRGETLGQRIFRTRALDTLPKTITHERIYIVPSRRGWMFVVSLLVMLIGAINYNLSLGYALCFLLTGLFAASLIATYRNFSGIRIMRVNQPEATLGENLNFTLTLANSGDSHRYGVDVGNADIVTRIDVPAQGDVPATVAITGNQRGWQASGRFTLSSDYPLGLWFTWSYIHMDWNGLVYPKPERKPPPLPFNNEANSQGQSRTATQGDFDSLREYQPGDSPGSIAWKTAARGLGLHTRQFVSEQPGSDLTLDWESTRVLGDSEQRLSRLAAWALQAHQSGIAYALEIPGHRTARSSGEPHLRSTLRHLALYGLRDADSGH